MSLTEKPINQGNAVVDGKPSEDQSSDPYGEFETQR